MDNLLEEYNSKKKENTLISRPDYIRYSDDLQFINNMDKAMKHWINHGINENRKYSECNLNLRESWLTINKYLQENKFQEKTKGYFGMHSNSDGQTVMIKRQRKRKTKKML